MSNDNSNMNILLTSQISDELLKSQRKRELELKNKQPNNQPGSAKSSSSTEETKDMIIDNDGNQLSPAQAAAIMARRMKAGSSAHQSAPSKASKDSDGANTMIPEATDNSKRVADAKSTQAAAASNAEEIHSSHVDPPVVRSDSGIERRASIKEIIVDTEKKLGEKVKETAAAVSTMASELKEAVSARTNDVKVQSAYTITTEKEKIQKKSKGWYEWAKSYTKGIKDAVVGGDHKANNKNMQPSAVLEKNAPSKTPNEAAR